MLSFTQIQPSGCALRWHFWYKKHTRMCCHLPLVSLECASLQSFQQWREM